MAGPPQYDGAMESVHTNGSQPAVRPSSKTGTTSRTSKTPALTHRMKHDKSILALAVSGTSIFAGTQGGEILVGRSGVRVEARAIDSA
jgi:di- and tripeptidase